MGVLEVKNVKKIYGSLLGVKVEALSNVSFEAEKGEFIAIMGESGSGKTTLLNIVATLDKPTAGSVFIDGREVNKLAESEIAAFRRNNLGFVFQDFNLLDTFTNRDNIYLPLVLSGKKTEELEEKINMVAKPLGIDKLLEKYPYEISGGQKQRVAIARAIITNPSLLLADEPTGALDSASSAMILDIFENLNKAGQTILMVTHSVRAAAHAGRVLFIKDGRVFYEMYRGDYPVDQFMDKINNVQSMLNKGGEISEQ